MKLWLSKESAVPLREQLVAQIKLAIFSQDLPAGARLPSTRELARRHNIHANTVSAVYHELSAQGYVDLRAGSGAYVRAVGAETQSPANLDLDRMIVDLLAGARTKGFSLGQVQERLRHWLRLQPPDHFLVIHADDRLREVLAAELSAATGFRVATAAPSVCAEPARLVGAILVALHGQAADFTALLPAHSQCLFIRMRSIPEILRGETMPQPDELIGVASSWPAFLQYTRTLLAAVRLDTDALIFRDAREADWQEGLGACSFVITDAATAMRLPVGLRARVFRFVSDESLAELRACVEQFIRR